MQDVVAPPPAPLAFDFRDPKEISAVSLSIDSPLEPIVGWARGISGTLAFDPARPERTRGTLAVAVSSVRFANDGYTATAQGYALNGKRWPELTIAVRAVERIRKTAPNHYEGTVLADFTCRGITKPKRLAVTADYFPGRAAERTNGQHKGDLLVLRTRFAVSRKEHGISEGIPDAMVGDKIEVGVAVVGIHYAETPKTPKTPAANPGPATPPMPAPTRTPADPRALPLPRLGPGAPLSLNAVRGAATGNPVPLVVLFLNEQCGVTVYYRDRLRRLVRDFAPKGFRFVAVRTGRKQHPGEPVDLPERATLPIPFLDDARGDLMRAYGVGQSLTFAVLDRAGRTRYLGGLDDDVDPRRVRRTPLRDALRALAANRPVPTPRFKMLGCAILPVQ